MPTLEDTRDVAPIVFGHGPAELEAFLEPTCPFSKRAFAKFPALVEAVGADKLTIRIRFLSQPWHLFSAVVTRAVLAACATRDGAAAGIRAMEAIYASRESFVCDNHSSGPNMNRSPAEVVAHIAELSGIDLAHAFTLDSVGRMVKWHARYCRQMGVHSSPSFAIERMLEPAMSSGQPVEEWAEMLKPYTG